MGYVMRDLTIVANRRGSSGHASSCASDHDSFISAVSVMASGCCVFPAALGPDGDEGSHPIVAFITSELFQSSSGRD